MGSYNVLSLGKIKCPRCGEYAVHEADFRYGVLDNAVYYVGDNVFHRDLTREEQNQTEVEGYVVCPICKKDYWVTIQLAEQKLQGFVLDLKRAPIVP